jgi:AraC family transcriptional activator of pobA
MLAKQQALYPFKAELIRTYLQPAIQEPLHLQPAETFVQYHNAAACLSAQSSGLLGQHLSLKSPKQTLELK